jgi:type I restriction enzyme S subunit
MKLLDIAMYVSEKIPTSNVNIEKYVSTENMIQNNGGLTLASSLPSSPTVNSFKKDDVLFSNIRPYFKKLWYAKYDGAVSSDVLVFRSIDPVKLNSLFLYYLLSSDKFIQYTVNSSIGTKMPRGDKFAIMNYEVCLPNIKQQKAIVEVLKSLDEKIENLNKQNITLESLIQTFFKSINPNLVLNKENEKS